MTTIGYAVLQIVPSLKGVSDAIEKQIEGKVVSVKIEPKVEQRAADDAGRKTRETVEKHTKSVKVEPKVDKAKAEKAGKDTGESVAKGVSGSSAIGQAVENAISGADLGGAVSKKMEATWGSIGNELGNKVVKPIFDELLEPALKDVAGKITTAASTKAVDLLGNAWQKTAEKIKDAGRKINSAVLRDATSAVAPASAGGGQKGAQAPVAAGPSAAVKNAGVVVGNALTPLVAGALDAALAELDLGPKIAAKLGPVGPVAEKLFNSMTASVAEFAASQTKAVASVAVEGLATAWNSVAASNVRAKVASAGAAIAQGAQMAATKAAAAAQWLMNAALTANPIGLVVTAIAAVVAGLVLFFTKTELGRKIWAGFTEYLKIAWEGIKTAFSTAWGAISTIWDGMVTKAGEVWEGIKSKFTAVVDFVKNLPSAISSAASGMWDGLKSGLVSVLNWIGDKWNSFADGLSIDFPGSAFDVTIPKMPHFYSEGGYTGNMPIGKVAGFVHGDEFVVKSGSRQLIENAYPGLLDYMNNNGRLPLPGYEAGGQVAAAKAFAKSMDPAKYLMGGFSTSAIDCSGFVSAVVNVATGRDPFSSRMSTVTEGQWLKSLGFQSGPGKPGDLRVGWWDKGGGANGHTAGTLPDGTNFESNGSDGVVVGGKTGASDGQFTNHAFLPMVSAGSPNGGGSQSSVDMLSALGLGSTAATGSAPTSVAPAAAAPNSGGGSTSFSIPDSLSSIGTWAGQQAGSQIGGAVKNSMGGQLPKQLETAVGGLGDLGAAAGQFVDGQVSSALGAFGVDASPRWLKGIAQYVSTIGIGGGGGAGFGGGEGGGANPVAPIASSLVNSAAPAAASALGSIHGAARAPTYNNTTTITAGDTEQAFMLWKRDQNERASARLDRYG